MPDYIKQYDLPCYPNKAPQPGCRTIVGLEKGNTFDKAFKGYSKWIGGCGIGRIEAGVPTSEALKELRQQVTARLRARADEAAAQLEWYIRLLQRWEENPEQFAVTPE